MLALMKFVMSNMLLLKSLKICLLILVSIKPFFFFCVIFFLTQFFGLDVPMTPWFKLICNSFLFKWWDRLDTIESVEPDNTIHRLGF